MPPDFIDLYPKLCFGHTKVPSNSVMCLVSARATPPPGTGATDLGIRYALGRSARAGRARYYTRLDSRRARPSARPAPAQPTPHSPPAAPRARTAQSPRNRAGARPARRTADRVFGSVVAKLHNSSSSDSNPALFLRAVRAARKSSSPTLRALITSSAACPELDVPPCSVTTAP